MVIKKKNGFVYLMMAIEKDKQATDFPTN
jgi:hypothetical protein